MVEQKMSKVRKGKTFNNKAFLYEGDTNSSLKVYPLDREGKPTGTKVNIESNAIELVKEKINEKLEIAMGACRDNPSPNSLGEMLYKLRKSPQWLSYILPLLEKEGDITHNKVGRAFWVRREIS